MSSVRYERRGASVVVTIDRRERRNAIDGATAAALADALERFEADDDAAVLVLTGAGDEAFCAGADLKAIDTLAGRIDDPGGPLGFTRRPARKPTIAAISGWCVAGGLELALWCDLRIATSTARFGCTERRFGVPLVDGGTQRLPRIVGLGPALDLILTGRVIDAERAFALGLVSEVVPPGEHLERSLALAERIASYPRRTLLADRRAALSALDLSLAEGLELERQLGRETLADAAAGAQRFARGEGRHGQGVPGTPSR